MRLWSIHPKYLDGKGLVALWREGLLAQNVLAGNTKGYKNHPQLARFKWSNNPLGAIASYLRFVEVEARARAYNFDRSKIANRSIRSKIEVTEGQLLYEMQHLRNKLKVRDADKLEQIRKLKVIEPHPLLKVIPGKIEDWEVL